MAQLRHLEIGIDATGGQSDSRNDQVVRSRVLESVTEGTTDELPQILWYTSPVRARYVRAATL